MLAVDVAFELRLQPRAQHLPLMDLQVRNTNVGDQYTEVVVPRPGDDDIPTTTTVSKPLYGKIRLESYPNLSLPKQVVCLRIVSRAATATAMMTLPPT